MSPAEDFCSIWQWLSIAPGSTILPAASMSRSPAAKPWPSATIVPFLMPMSQTVVSAAVATVPLRITRSNSAMSVPFRSAVIASRAAAKQSRSAGTMLMEIASLRAQ